MANDCWLPELFDVSDLRNWEQIYNDIYAIFHEDFIESAPIFEGKKVWIRKYPYEFGREKAFYHLTCQDYEKTMDRKPDLRRCERVRWIRAFIENYACDPSLCEDCDGVKVWSEPYKNTSRVYLLLEEELYVVILERRENYVLLVTAFYIDQDHKMDKLIRKWERYA